MNLEIKLNGGYAPTRAYTDDAGWDLFVVGDHTLEPGRFYDLPHEIQVAAPVGHWLLLHGRSSALRKRGLLVNTAVLDYGYTGELFTGVWCLSPNPVEIRDGERVSQLVPIPQSSVGVWMVDEMPDRARGGHGFGSCGR